MGKQTITVQAPGSLAATLDWAFERGVLYSDPARREWLIGVDPGIRKSAVLVEVDFSEIEMRIYTWLKGQE